jgi:23S rRNA G2445 N2-methylase RlmL
MDFDRPSLLRVTCAPALPPYLGRELEALGYSSCTARKTGVDLEGTLRDAMRLNLHLRTAFAVLYLLAEFPCDGPEALYDGASQVAWENIIAPDGYLSVASTGHHPTITDWRYANLKVKDAIVDRMARIHGRRPDSGPDRTGVLIHLHWENEAARLFINTSGPKLADRGYRRRPHLAPMQETLAAATLLAAGYDGSGPLLNPMCGSGTIAIEAALIATRKAPGLLRSHFGHAHVLGFDEAAWQAMRRDALKARRKTPAASIIASDIDERAIVAARANATTAGVDHLIEFHVCDFSETPIADRPGLVLMNPEYGERLGEAAKLGETYERIGNFLKQRCPGWRAGLFTGNLDLAKRIGLHAERRIPFFNAKLDCRLLMYEMYAGSRRKA